MREQLKLAFDESGTRIHPLTRLVAGLSPRKATEPTTPLGLTPTASVEL